MSSVGSVVPGTNYVTRTDKKWRNGVEYVRGRVFDVSDWSVVYDSGWQEEDDRGDAVASGISYDMNYWVAQEKPAVLFGEDWCRWYSPEGLVLYRWDTDQAILQKDDGTIVVGTCDDLNVPEVFKLSLEDIWKELGL